MVVLALVASATDAGIPAAASIEGRWRDAERHVLIQMARQPDGRWSGTAIDSPHPADIGKLVYRDLGYDPVAATWSGTLIKPDDGQQVHVVMTSTSPSELSVVARVFIFSKTLSLRREP